MKTLRMFMSGACALLATSLMADDLLVCSLLTDQVLRYDSTGAYVGVFASGPQIDGPEGITVGPDGNVYVASEYTGNVTKWSPTGAYLGEIIPIGTAGLTGEQDLEFGPDGHLYVMSHITLSSDSIWEFDASGTFLGMHGLGGGPAHVHGMSWRATDGNLYQTQLPGASGIVNRFDGPTGAILAPFAAAPEMAIASDILWGPDDDLYVSNPLISSMLVGGVIRFDGATGAYMGVFSSVGVPASSWGMAFHDGMFYYSVGSGVAVVDATTGGTATAFVTPGLGGLSGAASIAFLVPEPNSVAGLLFGVVMLGIGRRLRLQRR